MSGLCGTGSHHFRVDDVVVPAERTLPADGRPAVHRRADRAHPAAGAALPDDRRRRARCRAGRAGRHPRHRRRQGAAAGRAHRWPPTRCFQYELATADTELRAARALLYETADSVWATAVAGAPFTLEQRARVRAAAVWATARCSAVVDTAYRAGGGSSVYADCPLQRRLRDVHAITQHFLAQARHADHRRRRPRRPGYRRAGVLTPPRGLRAETADSLRPWRAGTRRSAIGCGAWRR